MAKSRISWLKMQYTQNLDPVQLALLDLLNLKRGDDPSSISRLDLDWEKVISLAERLKTLPILFDRLRPFEQLVPVAIFAHAKASFFRSSVRNLLIDHELGLMLRGFNAAEIPVILLKGVYLAHVVYAEPGFHPMADIDLMLHKEDISRAIDLLEGEGFIADRPFWMNVDGDLHYHAPVMSKNDVLVELHWNLTRESNLDMIDVSGLWQRSIVTWLEHGSARALGLSDLILHLAVHMAYGHRFHHQLQSLVDLDAVVRKFRTEVDWQETIGLCVQWQAERGTTLAFRLLKLLFDTPIPEDVIERLTPSDWRAELLDNAITSLFQEEPVLSENYVRVMCGTTVAEKMRGLINGLFPPRGVMAMEYALPLHSWKILLLYPHYAVNRVRKYWRHTWQLVKGDRFQQRDSQSAKELRDWLGV